MAKFSFPELIRSQRRTPAPVANRDLSSKTVVITGANTGLGFEAAKHFASMNPARLVLACRSKEKGEAAVKAIEEATGYNNSELWLLDLGRFASVIEFAERFEQDGGHIDILIANAGIAQKEYRVTSDGWEETLQINHLSTALLSILLLPRLIDAAVAGSIPRIVIVSSYLHCLAQFGEDPKVIESAGILQTLNDKTYCTKKVMADRYNASKMLNVFFTASLAAHLPPSSPIIVNCVHPGYCASGLTRNLKFPEAQVTHLMDCALAHTTEQGSRQLVWGAIGGEGREEELKGAYLSEANVGEASDLVIGDKGKVIGDRLWVETVEILRKVSSRFGDIVDGLGS